MDVGYIGPDLQIDVGPDIGVGPQIFASPGFVETISHTDEELNEHLRQIEGGDLFKQLRELGIIVPLSPVTTLTLTGSELRNEPRVDAGFISPPMPRSVTIASSKAQNDAGVFEFSW